MTHFRNVWTSLSVFVSAYIYVHVAVFVRMFLCVNVRLWLCVCLSLYMLFVCVCVKRFLTEKSNLFTWYCSVLFATFKKSATDGRALKCIKHYNLFTNLQQKYPNFLYLDKHGTDRRTDRSYKDSRTHLKTCTDNVAAPLWSFVRWNRDSTIALEPLVSLTFS